MSLVTTEVRLKLRPAVRLAPLLTVARAVPLDSPYAPEKTRRGTMRCTDENAEELTDRSRAARRVAPVPIVNSLRESVGGRRVGAGGPLAGGEDGVRADGQFGLAGDGAAGAVHGVQEESA